MSAVSAWNKWFSMSIVCLQIPTVGAFKSCKCSRTWHLLVNDASYMQIQQKTKRFPTQTTFATWKNQKEDLPLPWKAVLCATQSVCFRQKSVKQKHTKIPMRYSRSHYTVFSYSVWYFELDCEWSKLCTDEIQRVFNCSVLVYWSTYFLSHLLFSVPQTVYQLRTWSHIRNSSLQ